MLSNEDSISLFESPSPPPAPPTSTRSSFAFLERSCALGVMFDGVSGHTWWFRQVQRDARISAANDKVILEILEGRILAPAAFFFFFSSSQIICTPKTTIYSNFPPTTLFIFDIQLVREMVPNMAPSLHTGMISIFEPCSLVLQSPGAYCAAGSLLWDQLLQQLG